MQPATWSTRDVEASQLRGYWSKALDAIMPGLKFDPVEGRFQASLRQRMFGGVRLNHVSALPHRIRNVQRPCSITQSQFGIIFVKSGLLRVQQFARTEEFGAGDCVILDASQDSEVVTCRESESLNIAVSGGWLRQWLARPENDVAKVFRNTHRPARPLLELLGLLSDFDPPIPESGDIIASQLGGALALAVGSGQIVGTSHSARLLNRIKQGMYARFYDPNFSLQAAADEAGISRRYLVSLFAQASTTFNTELMRIRLDKSAEMLREPRFETLSVMDICLRCGFSDASHFSKRFRGQFDTSPASYRHIHSLGSATEDNEVRH